MKKAQSTQKKIKVAVAVVPDARASRKEAASPRRALERARRADDLARLEPSVVTAVAVLTGNKRIKNSIILGNYCAENNGKNGRLVATAVFGSTVAGVVAAFGTVAYIIFTIFF